MANVAINVLEFMLLAATGEAKVSFYISKQYTRKRMYKEES